MCCMWSEDSQTGVHVNSLYSRLNPLTLLPEEWDDRLEMGPFISSSASSLRHTGKSELPHAEFRKLSSEYACDPTLNLCLVLLALYSGCIRPLVTAAPPIQPESYYEGVTFMQRDPELHSLFGTETINSLATIVSQYPDVSSRKKSLSQVRAR